MTLQELKKGDKASVEAWLGSSPYQFSTEVLAAKSDGVYVKPIIFKGSVLDIEKEPFKGMSFNFYVIDSITKQRLMWKNVQIMMTTLMQNQVYFIKTFQFAKVGASAERRREERVVIDIPGFLWIAGNKIPIRIYDISSSGISFLVSKGTDTSGGTMEVEFADMVRGERYELMLTCRLARRVEKEKDSLIGCSFMKESRDLMFYLYNKRFAMGKS